MTMDELEALRRWKAEALEVISGLQFLGRALGLRPGTTITGPAAVEAVEALRAKVVRVEALADELAHPDPGLIVAVERAHRRTVGRELRAALADESEHVHDWVTQPRYLCEAALTERCACGAARVADETAQDSPGEKG